MPGVLALSGLLLARLTGTAGLAVYDADVPSDPPPTGWVIVYPGAGRPFTSLLGAVADSLDWDATVVCCGRTRQQCANTVDIVRSRLLGVRLGTSRATSPLREEVTGPILPDHTIPAEPRYSQTLGYRSNHNRS